ncbi:MAG: hypothetical protein GY711_31900 [bacterium]|nr:hypothetical protein [bacterium]
MTLLHRVLFVAWRSPRTGGIHPVARLIEREQSPRFEFVHVQGARTAVDVGSTPFIEFPDLDRVYESDDLFPLFGNRLMARKRPEYPSFLARLALPQSLETPIPILARSAGRRETDKIEVFGFPSFDSQRHCFVYQFFLRGVRHVAGAEDLIARLADGERLAWRREPDNPVSPLAIVVDREGGGQLGWVPATLSEDLDVLVRGGSDLAVFVERRNPAPAPVHERLLCRLEASAVPGFLPFSGVDYQPIPVAAKPLDLDTAELVA